MSMPYLGQIIILYAHLGEVPEGRRGRLLREAGNVSRERSRSERRSRERFSAKRGDGEAGEGLSSVATMRRFGGADRQPKTKHRRICPDKAGAAVSCF